MMFMNTRTENIMIKQKKVHILVVNNQRQRLQISDTIYWAIT